MTRFNLSSRDPGSWSAAVSRNFSVFVAEGNMDSAGLFSVGTIGFKDPVVTLAAGTAGVERLPGSRACCIWPLGTIVDADVVVQNEEDTRDGATVVGGEKNVPS